MYKRYLWGTFLLCLLWLVAPAAGLAQIDCSTARPDFSLESTDGEYAVEEHAQVFLTFNRFSCYVKTNMETGYKYELSKDCTCFSGKEADEWVYATSGTETYWYRFGRGWKISDKLSPIPASVGFLSEKNRIPILNNSDLPAGTYKITYAVDHNRDQRLDKSFSREITIDVNTNGDCRNCHESQNHPDPTSMPDRHHKLVEGKGMACIDCHQLITTNDGEVKLGVLRVCEGCHNQAEQLIVSYPRPMPDMSATERHHTRAIQEGWDCIFCHE